MNRSSVLDQATRSPDYLRHEPFYHQLVQTPVFQVRIERLILNTN